MKMMFVAGLLVLACALAQVAAKVDDTADARLAAFFKRFLDEDHADSPLTATRRGDHRFEDKLDDFSAAGLAASRERYRRTLAELPQAVDFTKLSRDGQIDFEILQHHLKQTLWEFDHGRAYERDPRVYVEALTESTYLPLVQSSLPSATNVKNVTARMAQLPKVVAAAKALLAKECPKPWVETAIQQAKGAVGFYQRDIYELAGETPALSAIRGAAPPVIAALEDYIKFLETERLPQATDTWRLGPAKFAEKLDLELNAGLSAAQVLTDAQAEAARVEMEMYVIARQMWARLFPGQPLPPDDPQNRRFTVQSVLHVLAKDHGTNEGLVRDIEQSVEECRRFIKAKDILRLPEPDRCRVIVMPEFRRGFSVAYLHQAPPLDPAVESFYAISPPPAAWNDRQRASYLEEYNRHMLRILTIHEAYPGHYVQLEYSNRHPSLIRKVLFSGVFAEGWAVYTEQMMLDQGFGADADPLALRLHQLKFYLRAVVNALLDHAMHCANMTDDQAMELLTKRAFQTEGEALGKVVRAKLSSCQLSTYFVGRMAFYRLRQEVQREQGATFDLGRYHEAVLAHGTLPVKYLPELVRVRLKQPR